RRARPAPGRGSVRRPTCRPADRRPGCPSSARSLRVCARLWRRGRRSGVLGDPWGTHGCAATAYSDLVSDTTPAPGPARWLTLAEVAERLDVAVSKVHRMIREGALLAVRRDGEQMVPAELVANRTVLKHLPGVLTLLHDAG